MQLTALISKRIKDLLKQRKWTRYELARRAAIPCSTLYYTLAAEGDSLKTSTLINICRGFGINMFDFFNDPMFELENIADN
ncbi:MAG: helix-turn-helix transcriptional regulator [Clostridia bacterium]|nr:helix-turn-helix transcriptional regulator [Clostridia bacterium]